MASNLDIVKGVYAAFAKGDIPAFLGALDEKVEWTEPEGLGPVFTSQIGPQAVAENVLGTVMQQVTDFSANPEEFIDGGDVIVALGHYRGKGASTGKQFEARNAHVWRIKDGKIAGLEVITDTHIWRDALGLS
jgi:ketosteroid isomerase-like protein